MYPDPWSEHGLEKGTKQTDSSRSYKRQCSSVGRASDDDDRNVTAQSREEVQLLREIIPNPRVCHRECTHMVWDVEWSAVTCRAGTQP